MCIRDRIAAPSPDKSLKNRTAASGAAMLVGFGAGHILRLISNLILVRFLLPEAFGLMAVAVSINILAVMMADMGIRSAVVRSANVDDPKFLHTAWTLEILRGATIWIFVVIAAFIVAALSKHGAISEISAYADPRLPLVMIATGAQLFLVGFVSMNQIVMERKLSMNLSLIHI